MNYQYIVKSDLDASGASRLRLYGLKIGFKVLFDWGDFLGDDSLRPFLYKEAAMPAVAHVSTNMPCTSTISRRSERKQVFPVPTCPCRKNTLPSVRNLPSFFPCLLLHVTAHEVLPSDALSVHGSVCQNFVGSPRSSRTVHGTLHVRLHLNPYAWFD